MKSKVVRILSQTFNDMGLFSAIISCRGVGEGAGRYGHGHGESADLAAVVTWFRARCPQAPASGGPVFLRCLCGGM
jgi:alpha/beta superfamily hydrolase